MTSLRNFRNNQIKNSFGNVQQGGKIRIRSHNRLKGTILARKNFEIVH